MFNESSTSRARVALEAAHRFEVASGLIFRDKTLLQRALTHRSFLNETRYLLQADNERLEFLGDAVLDFIVGEYLYNRFPEMREGMLTNLRAALVREETLAAFALQLNLGYHLMMGRGEAESGGRERPATLCAAFEALVGALYLDQDLEAVKTLLFSLVEPAFHTPLPNGGSQRPRSRQAVYRPCGHRWPRLGHRLRQVQAGGVHGRRRQRTGIRRIAPI